MLEFILCDTTMETECLRAREKVRQAESRQKKNNSNGKWKFNLFLIYVESFCVWVFLFIKRDVLQCCVE